MHVKPVLPIYFNTSPDFWLNLQRANDIYQVLHKQKSEIDSIQSIIASQIMTRTASSIFQVIIKIFKICDNL